MIEFQKIPDLYIEKAKFYAETFSNAKLYKEKLKQLLAVLMTEYISKGESAAKSEAYAKADPRYVEKLKETQQVLLDAEVGRAGLKSLELSFEYYRSTNSLRKKEINLL